MSVGLETLLARLEARAATPDTVDAAANVTAKSLSIQACTSVTPITVERQISDRHFLMRIMADWNERAAMMMCGDVTAEQAETAAWYDLKLDEVFFGVREYAPQKKTQRKLT